jgi:hypothetical protein
MELTPIEQLVNNTDIYTCSRNLFSFVNRSLNEMGQQAKIISMAEGDLIIFGIAKLNKLRRD